MYTLYCCCILLKDVAKQKLTWLSWSCAVRKSAGTPFKQRLSWDSLAFSLRGIVRSESNKGWVRISKPLLRVRRR